jgi:hypothetical protein
LRPSLSRKERRELSLRLLELDGSAVEAEDLAVCGHSATLGFALLDELEAKADSK